jgi:hypothetical protein
MCGASEHGGPKTAKHFAIDHDHTTGKVRGLLCFRCNVCLGRLGDTKDAVAAWAKAAGEYLEDNMAKKIQLGEKVRVKTKDGEGVGTYVGNDDVSGMPIVNMEKLTVDNGVKKIDLKNVPAYVVPDAMRRG